MMDVSDGLLLDALRMAEAAKAHEQRETGQGGLFGGERAL